MGEPGQQCIDEDWPIPPETPYGKAKRAAERYVDDASAKFGMHTVVLRLALVYGPGVKGNLERMAVMIRRGLFPPLPEVGNKRSMVHVEDVVRAALHCADDPRAFRRTYIMTDGHPYSGREIYCLLCRAVGRSPRTHGVPFGVLRTVAAAGDVLGRLRGKPLGFNGEALDKLLGWACYRCDRIQLETGFQSLYTLEQSMPAILMNDEPREC
jgi:nucleoside-diphosphate-sugar epimerase